MSTTFKTILSGCLEFGNQRSYEQVLKLFQHRTENYYRNDVLLNAEDIFKESSYTLDLPRFISECPEKSWKNTSNLLGYVAQYAIAGDIRMWVIQEGKLIADKIIEPSGDKSAIQAYLKGRDLVKESGKEEEAMKALNRAIEKFERHGKAYERRGYINFRLRNYDDAMYDFSKSIDIHPNSPDAYWGRANVKIKKGDIAGAIEDLGKTTKTSIPHQPIYWSARRLKGELHLQLEEFEKAIFELKLVTKRLFKPNDPNFKWKKSALANYAEALFQTGQYAEAVQVLNQAFDLKEEFSEDPNPAQLYLRRGLALQKTGEPGCIDDFKKAADLGSEKAAEMLQQLVES
ncbi:MAG TPA: tetratricopeptide repeat protein [Bacteroidetes bacterium]|nr:tetratricopeptide repeat protein [Bacteroidota bacterium]